MDKSGISLFSPFEQAIDHFIYKPATNWQRFFNPQFTFNYNPEDQEVEQHVLNRVGSYGRQLGILIDMLDLMRTRLLDENQLSPCQQIALEEFKRLAMESRMAVADFGGERKPPTAARLVTELGALKERSPAEFAQIKQELGELMKES